MTVSSTERSANGMFRPFVMPSESFLAVRSLFKKGRTSSLVSSSFPSLFEIDREMLEGQCRRDLCEEQEG
jgi:hypothetical protein